MKSFAKRNGIKNSMALSISVLVEMYKLEKERTRRILADSAWMRTEYLNAKLKDAINAEKDDDVKRPETLIQNERQQKTWRGIQYVTKKNRVGGVTKVVIPRSNKEDEVCNTKTAVKKGLANSLSECFSCAESAPICQGALFELLGYSADTETAEDILEGTFIPPPDTDPATIITLDEIARIWSKMATGEMCAP